ncbi:MAG: DUF4123 domain-containing protein [Gemmatimonadales bacterium]
MADLVREPVSFGDLERWSDGGRLFAILDACDQPAVPEFCQDQPDDIARSLYLGRADEELWAIAPYVVRVEPATLAWIRSDLWAEPWGVFLAADARLDELHRHFRQFLIVSGPQGQDWYFRFYDPRVLPRFLTSASVEDAERFFGPVAAYAVPDGAQCLGLSRGTAPVGRGPIRITLGRPS